MKYACTIIRDLEYWWYFSVNSFLCIQSFIHPLLQALKIPNFAPKKMHLHQKVAQKPVSLNQDIEIKVICSLVTCYLLFLHTKYYSEGEGEFVNLVNLESENLRIWDAKWIQRVIYSKPPILATYMLPETSK